MKTKYPLLQVECALDRIRLRDPNPTLKDAYLKMRDIAQEAKSEIAKA